MELTLKCEKAFAVSVAGYALTAGSFHMTRFRSVGKIYRQTAKDIEQYRQR